MNLEEYKEYIQAMAERKSETKTVMQKPVKRSRLVKKQFVRTKR